MRTASASIALLALSLLPGCLPSQIGMGVTVLKPFHEPIEVRPAFRVGIDPFQLMPGRMNRDVDASVGVVTELHHPTLKDGEAKSSLYAQVMGVTARTDLGQDAVFRTSAGGAARLSWDADHRFRPGLEPMIMTEVSQFSRENYANRTGMAHTFGEMGAGLSLSGFFDAKGVGVTAGVLMRSPLGIMVPGEM